MNEYMFGLGRGHLSARAARAAKAAGAVLVNYTDPGCSCGHGCGGRIECPANRRHWFATRNYGDPHNRDTARAVMAAVHAAATKSDRRLMGME